MRILILLCGLSHVYASIRTCYYLFNDPPVSLIEDGLCTHIILIGQTKIDALGLFEKPPISVTENFKSIKKYAPSSKLMICITGTNSAFSKLVSSSELMLQFANSTFDYLKENNLDGLDFDWEFPVWSTDARKSDKQLFINLLKITRQTFGSEFLITAAVSGPPTISRVAYDVSALNRYLDYIQIMNYDFHIFNYLYPVVGFNAPLRKLKGETGILAQMNSEASMATWDEIGLWQNKTLFGIPTYSRAYLLVNKFLHKPYSISEGSVDGYAKRAVICELLKDSKTYKYVWNKHAASPYLYGNDKLWISTEDERSVREKAKFAESLKIAGIMIFDLGSDDYYGTCGNGAFPLIKAIKSVHN